MVSNETVVRSVKQRGHGVLYVTTPAVNMTGEWLAPKWPLVGLLGMAIDPEARCLKSTQKKTLEQCLTVGSLLFTFVKINFSLQFTFGPT
jgi:hypothetical protein